MNKRKLLLILACGCILTACSAEVADVEGTTAQGTTAQVETSTTVEENGTAESEVAQTESFESEIVASSEASMEASQSETSSEEKKEVHRTTVKKYNTVDGAKTTDVVTIVTEQTFDGEGNMVLEEIYDGTYGRSLSKRTIYIYDERGNMLRSKEKWDDISVRSRIIEYTYDDKNQCIKTVLVATEGGEKDTTYLDSYDDAGNLVETQCLQEEKMLFITKYSYDEAGNILCQSSNIPSEGDAWEDITYQYVYDDAGNILKMEEFQYGNLYYTLVCTYDERGNMLTKAESGVDVVGPALHNYEYDEQGNCIKMAHLFAENEPFWTDSREYDAEGRLLKSTTTFNDGTGVVEEYQYEIVEE